MPKSPKKIADLLRNPFEVKTITIGPNYLKLKSKQFTNMFLNDLK